MFVNGRPDVAAALGAQGVQLARRATSHPADARRQSSGGLDRPLGALGRRRPSGRVDEGADFLLVGTVYRARRHPGRPRRGLGLVRATAAARPAGDRDRRHRRRARPREVREAGAYGVAAIGALWRAADPAAAALALLAPWLEDA